MNRFLARTFLELAFSLPTLLAAGPAAATDFFVVPVKISLPIHLVVPDGAGERIVKKTLKEKDIVNLALGRPLGTKVDKKREILAVAGARFREDVEKGRLIVFDPSQNGLAQVIAEVAKPLVFDAEIALLKGGKEGHGTVTGEAVESELGDPTKNAILTGIGWVSGSVKRDDDKRSYKGIVAGRGSFRTTENGQTTTFSGFIVKGKAKASGKPIGMYTDGAVSPGCGNGIIEPNLGEECEFSNQTACPGKCNACTCRVCGNARIDPGEICDGTAVGVCAQLTPPVPCKPDCSGCAVCGDGVVSPNEECDVSGSQAPCPGLCLFPKCQCGCDTTDPEACPDHLCCGTDRRCWAAKTGFPSDDPNSTVSGGQGCSGGGVQPSGLCGGVVAPGALCPDQDADNNTLFLCHACNGKGVHKICAIGAQSCVLDQIGPVP